jgi:LPS export ABC transporter protein LptC
VLEVTGMTFVGNRGDERKVVLRSKRAIFHPDTNRAELEEVEVVVSDRAEQEDRSFEMSCDRADLDVETNDFYAEGNVRGATSGGQRYQAAWVRYAHDEGLLQTDAPVSMVDATGSFRGDGFRYLVHEKRFRLLGNVRVEQTP